MADTDLETGAPTVVKIVATAAVRFTPNELRALKAETGHTMTELLGPEADDGDRFQTMAWLQLRRQGQPVSWEALGDSQVEVQPEEAPDPTNAAPSRSWPGSVVSGG